MESRRKENFSEASAVHKGEFRNFFNVGVEEVNPLKQSATVTRVRSNSCKIRRESKCGDSRRARPASGGWKLTEGNLSKVDASLKETMPELGFAAEPICNPVRCMHPF